MGMTDQFIIPQYSKLVGDFINKNMSPGCKIAWLGQQQKDKYSDMFKGIESNIEVPGLVHHFYDIENDHNPPVSFKWDVHDSWNETILNYDLVVGLRLAYLVQSSSGLARNIKSALKNNKRVILDFNTGNITRGNNGVIQRWKEGSTNLIPHFPEVFPFKIGYFVNHKDNLFSSDLLKSYSIAIKKATTIKDPIKGRIYVLAEFAEL